MTQLEPPSIQQLRLQTKVYSRLAIVGYVLAFAFAIASVWGAGWQGMATAGILLVASMMLHVGASVCADLLRKEAR